MKAHPLPPGTLVAMRTVTNAVGPRQAGGSVRMLAVGTVCMVVASSESEAVWGDVGSYLCLVGDRVFRVAVELCEVA